MEPNREWIPETRLCRNTKYTKTEKIEAAFCIRGESEGMKRETSRRRSPHHGAARPESSFSHLVYHSASKGWMDGKGGGYCHGCELSLAAHRCVCMWSWVSEENKKHGGTCLCRNVPPRFIPSLCPIAHPIQWPWPTMSLYHAVSIRLDSIF